ncbi:MAG: hypothetical protein H6564_06785 [Lewinellaceae bacterium]|nr:hypothetical protein [Lewinellaceae bacterium]
MINPDQKIVDLFYQMTRIGDLPLLVEQYLTEIKISNPEASLKNEMVRFLLDLKLDFSITDPTQTYDEFFGQAYIHALKVESGREDPIDKIYSPGSISGWNFEVDYFTTAERQGISPDNILAAGALDYIYELGDNLGIFRVTDALVLMWAQGRLELSQARYNNRVVVNGIVEGDAASRLYRYYKLRDSRLTYEERAMIYKQVLNKGQANLLSRMNPNTDFTLLWVQLMSEVVDFIGKSEKHFSFDNMVSRSSLYQSTQNLQYNLTFNMVGKPLNDVHEMYAQLQECISILGHAEIVDQLSGGGIKNMWTVVDKVSRQELGFAPNISASRTAAVEGHKIFKWISGFDENSVDDQVFKNFVNSAEAYIIAKGQTTEQRSPLLMEGNGSNGVSAGIEDSDEFADWD